MDGACWIVTCETGPDRARNRGGAMAPLDRAVVIGREGDLRIGVDPDDDGVSRTALTVTPTVDGWRIERSNRNGAVLHPWGLDPHLAPAVTLLDWPLVAIRVTGTDDTRAHWVLLESQVLPAAEQPVDEPPDIATTHSDAPKPLTPAEGEALWTVFGEVLAWPPRPSALPLQLKQAARRLGITESGVQLRLEGAQRKALVLGLPRAVRLTEPAYLHVLVGAGYLAPPRIEPVRAAPA